MTEIDTLKYELSYYKVINANLKEIIKLQKVEYKELKKAFSLTDVVSSLPKSKKKKKKKTIWDIKTQIIEMQLRRQVNCLQRIRT